MVNVLLFMFQRSRERERERQREREREIERERERDDKHSNRKQVFNVTLIPFPNQILEHCRNQNDEWTKLVKTRLSCSNDLLVDEAVYHKECLKKFILYWPSFEAQNKPKGRPVDKSVLQLFEMLCVWLEVEADAKLNTVTEQYK